jgi:peptidoglycan/xylan/chitin deacetylase (PgdA/CDA1 family)
LHYGITDEWKDQDMIIGTNSTSSNTLFLKLMKIQLDRKLPFGDNKERYQAELSTNLVMTSDLCPASPHYARLFYDSISNFNIQAGINIPLVIFFSGKWIENHARDLEKIKSYPFSFTAGNHSYRHIILTNSHSSDLLVAEVTNNERIMLENGLLPSYIFRFPGLKHSRKDIAALSSINILALDANVWMGNKIRNWKILLVHSNGNATPEVLAFSRFLTNKVNLFKEKKIVFRDVFDYFHYTAFLTNY